MFTKILISIAIPVNMITKVCQKSAEEINHMNSIKDSKMQYSNSKGHDIYWEKQELWRLCGLHCLNSILQGPIFNEVELSEIAHELDQKEKKLMAELGTETEDFLRYMAEDSINVSEDGNFSVQVLEEALKRKSLEFALLDTKKVFMEEEGFDQIDVPNKPPVQVKVYRELKEMCHNFGYMLFAVRGNLEKFSSNVKSKEYNSIILVKGKKKKDLDSKRQFWFKESDVYELNGKPYHQEPHIPPALNDAVFHPASQLPPAYQQNYGPAISKFELQLEENAESITLNFRLPSAELLTFVFPRAWCLEDLYEFVNYKTNQTLRGFFQIITNYPDFSVLPPTKIFIYQTGIVTGQTLFVRMLPK